MALLSTLAGLFKKKKDEEIQPINIPANTPISLKGINLGQPMGGGGAVKADEVKPLDLSGISNLGQSLANVFKNVSQKINIAPPPPANAKAYNPKEEPLFDAYRSSSLPKIVEPLAKQPIVSGWEGGPTVGGIIQSIAQLPPRAVLRIGMTRDKLLGQPTKEFVPQTEMEKFILGNEPITDIEEGIKRAQQKLAEFGIKGPAGGLLAGAGVIGGTALDINPLYGIGKTGAVKTGEELASVLKAGLKIKPIDLEAGESAVKVGWDEASKVLDKLNLDPELLKKLNAGEVIDGAKFVIQKQGEQLLVNIDKTFKPATEAISKGIKLTKGKKAPKVETPPPPEVSYVDPATYADSLSTETHLGQTVGTKKIKNLELPDYAKQAEGIDRNQVEAIKSSVQAGDKINPLVLDEAGNITDGAHRLTALQELGIKEAQFVKRVPKMGAYSAEATDQTLAKSSKAFELAQEKQAKADFDEWQKAVFNDAGVRTTSKAVDALTDAIKTGSSSKLADTTDLKDIGVGTVSTRDFFRNFEKVYGDRIGEARAILLDPFDNAKNTMIRNLQSTLDELKTNVVDGLGIAPKSKESAMVQIYGEANDAERAGLYQEMVKDFGQQKADNIVQADTWFRDKYNQLLDEVNAVRQQIYPNDPEKLIPKRQDYYRHFQELSDGFLGLKNIFEQPSGIASELAGRSEFMKPLTKFLSFAQRRTGDSTTYDAVSGFLNYVKSAEYAKNIDPFVGQFRQLAEELAQATPEGGENARQLTNFIQFLRMYADDLSGKSGILERVFPKIFGEKGGRKILSVLNWANSRVKANTILANVSSSISQIWNVPQAIADVGFRTAVSSVPETLQRMFADAKGFDESNFINERYASKAFEQFDTGMLSNLKKFAMWMTTVTDEAGTKFIWTMEKNKLLDEGVDATQVAREADIATRKMVAGRGIGEVPLMQKDRVFQLVAPFQVEVGNMWWVMKDWVSEKEFSKFAKFFVVNYFLNRTIEQVGGNPIGFDPIQAGIEAKQASDEGNPVGAVGRITGEVLSQVPGVNVGLPAFLQMNDAQKKEFFGRRDPTRFGSGILIGRGLADPLFKLLPPFGGAQVEKTLQGTGAVTTGYQQNPGGELQYPIHQSGANYVRGFLFGKYSFPEARQYFENELKPLGVNDTILVRALLGQNEDAGFKAYDQIIQKREVQSVLNAVRGKITDAKLIITDPKSTEEDKQRAYQAIQDEAVRANKKLKDLLGKEADTTDVVNPITPLDKQTFAPIDVNAQVPEQPARLAVTGKASGKKVKAPKISIPKVAGIKLSIPSGSTKVASTGIKKISPPPKTKGVRLAQARKPKVPRPRRFKVNRLRVS